jgi:glycosyltransferase involved in cell wall biosynthesis
LSLAEAIPTLETDFRPQWQYLPSAAPRILARPLTNGQGVFRITSPLRALRRAGLASECVWDQEGPREPSTAELLRLAPDTVIVQHYLHDRFLAALQAWKESPDRPFVVYAMDDLLTDMAESNPLRRNIPANSWARLKYALARCDRLVTSTEFLAETYRHFIPDIKVVPNRLEKDIWLPLQSRRRTGPRPRVGWAGGSTHQGDLVLLKEVIEQTRHEADWVFFGMCPDEIRPLLAEYHPFGDFAEYPARLAALNLDIAVAPLAQIPFNQGKSNLRLLEYGVLGIPVVCTDIDPYRGSPACCVANTAISWTAALRERIHDADAREKEGNAMRQWVHRGYLLENHLDEWLGAHLPDRK